MFSWADGSIWKGNLKTGEGQVVVKGPGPGMAAVGLAYDKRTDYLYACGGPTGKPLLLFWPVCLETFGLERRDAGSGST